MTISDVYINVAQDRTVLSAVDGTARTVVLTPKKYWGLGLNCREAMVGLRITTINGGRVSIGWQYSLDGQKWKDGNSVIANQTTTDDFVGIQNTPNQMLPFVRLVAKVDDATPTVQRTALISVWTCYKYDK